MGHDHFLPRLAHDDGCRLRRRGQGSIRRELPRGAPVGSPECYGYNVSVDVSAVAYFRVVGQHTLDETRSETGRINIDIKAILDVATEDGGVEVTLVELKDIQLPDSPATR